MATSRLAAALASLASLSMATTAPALAAPDRAVPAGPGLEQPARIGAAPAAPPTAPAVPAIGSDADASRKDGWRFDIGGRLQFHYDDFRGLYSNDGNPASVGYLRRGRFELGARRGDFVFGLDLEPQEAGPAWLNKLYVTYRGFKPTDITIGRFKPDFGLEQAISSKWTTTTERSAIWELAPDATDYEAAVGIEVRTHGDRHHGVCEEHHPLDRLRTVVLVGRGAGVVAGGGHAVQPSDPEYELCRSVRMGAGCRARTGQTVAHDHHHSEVGREARVRRRLHGTDP